MASRAVAVASTEAKNAALEAVLASVRTCTGGDPGECVVVATTTACGGTCGEAVRAAAEAFSTVVADLGRLAGPPIEVLNEARIVVVSRDAFGQVDEFDV